MERLAIVILKPRFAVKIYSASECRLISLETQDELDQMICALIRDGWHFTTALDHALFFVVSSPSAQSLQKEQEIPAEVFYQPDPVTPGPILRQGQAVTYDKPEMRGKKGEK